MTHFKILLILRTTANTYVSPYCLSRSSLIYLQTLNSTYTCASLYLLNRNIKGHFCLLPRAIAGRDQWWFLISWTSHLERRMQQEREEGWKEGVTAAVGVLITDLKRWLEMSWHTLTAAFIQGVNNIYYLLPDCTSATRSDEFSDCWLISFWGAAAARWGFVCTTFLIAWHGWWILESLFECRLNLPLEQFSALCNRRRALHKRHPKCGLHPQTMHNTNNSSHSVLVSQAARWWALSLVMPGYK